MADLLESSATTTTQAPSYYTDYLNNLANKGTAAAGNAQFIGAQPLQQQAFTGVQQNVGAYRPGLQTAQNYLGQATNQSPLSAAQPYFENADVDPSKLAMGYMSPYTESVVKSIGDLSQRNIQQNLAPQATAGAVGSGQFGSQRGAQVLGQTIQNANTDALAQQNQALQAGYTQALTAAQKQQALEAQLGQSAGQLAGTGQTNLINASNVGGTLAGQAQALGLADVNALSTLGGQQQQILQNQQLFPMQNLNTASGLLRGYNIPTSSKQVMQGSPLSAIAGLGTVAAQLSQPTYSRDASGALITTPGLGTTLYNDAKDIVKSGYNAVTDYFSSPSTTTTTPAGTDTSSYMPPADYGNTYIAPPNYGDSTSNSGDYSNFI